MQYLTELKVNQFIDTEKLFSYYIIKNMGRLSSVRF